MSLPNSNTLQGLVRGEDNEDNLVTAARTVTRKRKVVDESAKKVTKRKSVCYAKTNNYD